MVISMLLLIISGALLILPYIVATQDALGQNNLTLVTSPMPGPGKCQLVTNVRICENTPWNYTLFPNFRGHSSQTEANQELEQFRQLIEVNCSGAIVIFLCSIYTPFCTDDHPLRVLRPCKRLCQHVRDGCEPVFNQRAGGLPWPDHLNCDNYEDNDLCFGPQGLNEITIPPHLLHPGGGTTGTSDAPGDTSVPTNTSTASSMLSKCPIEMIVTPNIRYRVRYRVIG